MKIKVLGTSACEGIPSLFCNCEVCQQARKLKGKEIRTRSQLIIDDCMIIDYPVDTYMHALHHEIDLSAIKYMLFTHSHSDHFYGKEFCLRGLCYASNIKEEILSMFMGKDVYKKFEEETAEEMSEEVLSSYKFNILNSYDVVKAGNYKITVLPAEHSLPESFLYLIESNGKTYFHCYDTGYPYEEVLEYFKENDVKIDCVLMDCTMGSWKQGKNRGHMGFEDCVELKNELIQNKTCTEKTKFVLTHFSHYGKMLHMDYENVAKEKGLIIAYDGMEIKL